MNQNELMSKKHKKVCGALNYIDHSLIVISTITGCVSISPFASLLISVDEYESLGTHWITLYVNAKNVTYFDRLGVEHTPKEIKKFIENNNIITII